MKRRDFIIRTGACAAALAAGKTLFAAGKKTDINSKKLPRFRGFNLLNKFDHRNQTPFAERDFEMIKNWGFNCVRLPLSYWCWSSEADWFSMNETVLKEIDAAVEFGRQYGIHVNINFHRAPGYRVNEDWEIKLTSNLFEDEAPLEACAFQWKKFAERYKGIPNRNVSFNLVNEPGEVAPQKYDKVARRVISEIRSADPNRMVFLDGLKWGNLPLESIADMGNIVQCSRGYNPMLISHCGATWAGDFLRDFPPDKLSWPLKTDWGEEFSKESLRENYAQNWDAWEKTGNAAIVGEMGCYNKTPHKIALAWLGDLFDIYKERNWGWCLWNLHGSFGILNSERQDVKYEKLKSGELLDRKMLELLLRS